MLKAILISLLTFMTTLSIHAASQQYEFSEEYGRKQIRFYSETAKEGFEGIAHEMFGTLSVDFSKRNLDLTGRIEIPVMGMQTGITLRDVHMRSKDWLNEGRFPSIRFKLDSPDAHKVKKKGKKKWFAEVSGQIYIRGRSRKIKIPITIERKSKKKDTIVVKGGFNVHLEDFNVRGPAAMRMIGAKVSPDIKITLKLVGKARSRK